MQPPPVPLRRGPGREDLRCPLREQPRVRRRSGAAVSASSRPDSSSTAATSARTSAGASDSSSATTAARNPSTRPEPIAATNAGIDVTCATATPNRVEAACAEHPTRAATRSGASNA